MAYSTTHDTRLKAIRLSVYVFQVCSASGSTRKNRYDPSLDRARRTDRPAPCRLVSEPNTLAM